MKPILSAVLAVAFTSCLAGEDFRGPKGEQGDTGKQGPRGERGPTGPAWKPDVYYRVGGFESGYAWCDVGDAAVGGSCLPFDHGAGQPAVDVGDEVPVGWSCQPTYQTTVICLRDAGAEPDL